MAMEDEGVIEPSSFDVIVLGTGLPECILAAAAAAAGKSVLHLDPCDFYGSFWSSLPLHHFSSFISTGCRLSPPAPPIANPASSASSSAPESFHPTDITAEQIAASDSSLQELEAVDPQHHIDANCSEFSSGIASGSSFSKSSETELDGLGLKAIHTNNEASIYSDVSVSEYDSSLHSASRAYNLDLAGPKLLLCGDSFVELLLRSKTNNYLEFKSIEATYIWSGGGLVAVPSSRADVFKDRSLSLREKRFLMRFFKLVSDFATSSSDGSTFELSANELESPFVDFLRQQELPASIQAMILYAIALADDDQEQQSDDSFRLVTVREGLERLALYLSSVNRFPNALGAYLYPLYGQGELAQAFCRLAAVKGALYVLRRNVNAILMEKDMSHYKGIRTGSGQILYSQKLVVGPSLLCLENVSNHMSCQQGLENLAHGFHTHRTVESSSSPVGSGSRCWKVARFVCITDSSLQPDQHNILMVFPPRSLSGTFSCVVRALQLSSNTSACPEGRFVVQFSTLCLHGQQAKEAIQSIVEALFWSEDSASDVTSKELGETSSDLVQRPKIVWSSFYVQPLSINEELQVACNGVCFSTLPSQALDYGSIMRFTEKIFHELFEDLEWFPNDEATDMNDDEKMEPEESNSLASMENADTVASMENSTTSS